MWLSESGGKKHKEYVVKLLGERRLVGRGRDGLILKKRGFDVWQTRRVVHDRSVWRGFVGGNARGMNP